MRHALGSDPLTGQLVVDSESKKDYASQVRAGSALVAAQLPREPEVCPFCPGAPGLDQRTVDRVGDPSAWQSVAIRNRFPYDTGEHMLVICSPRHTWAAHAVSAEELSPAMVVRARVEADLAADPDARWVASWLSYGAAAGASQPHAHIQVLTFPMVPPAVAAEAASCAGPGCVLCSPNSTAVGHVAGGVVHLSCPGATLVVAAPEHRMWSPEQQAQAVVEALAVLVAVRGPVAYNLTWHTGPLFAGHPHVHITDRSAPQSAAEILEGWSTVAGTWQQWAQVYRDAMSGLGHRS